MSNILVIGAHYDDSELGAGGTMARCVRGGNHVYKLTLTDNVTNFEQRGISVDHSSSVSQSAMAARVLGVKEVDFQPIACNHLSYSAEVMQRVERVIFDLGIDTVFIHYHSDMNQDHVEASRICLTAARHCRNIFMYQSNGYVLENDYYPRLFIDISATIAEKRKALGCYADVHDRYGRLFDTVCKRNEVWGFHNEIDAAEGFHVVKMRI